MLPQNNLLIFACFLSCFFIAIDANAISCKSCGHLSRIINQEDFCDDSQETTSVLCADVCQTKYLGMLKFAVI